MYSSPKFHVEKQKITRLYIEGAMCDKDDAIEELDFHYGEKNYRIVESGPLVVDFPKVDRTRFRLIVEAYL